MAFNTQGDDNEISNINITPMVDIMLVLLVIFIVTANFIKIDSLNINLPKASVSDTNAPQSIQVAITRDGRFLLEGESITQERLVERLANDVKIKPDMRVTLAADESLSYGTIAKMLETIKKSGVTRIALSVISNK